MLKNYIKDENDLFLDMTIKFTKIIQNVTTKPSVLLRFSRTPFFPLQSIIAT